jgi:hypothetical protein
VMLTRFTGTSAAAGSRISSNKLISGCPLR